MCWWPQTNGTTLPSCAETYTCCPGPIQPFTSSPLRVDKCCCGPKSKVPGCSKTTVHQNSFVEPCSVFADILDIAVYRNELFCLHGNGRLSHFSLLSAERCVERLLRRESWALAASVCCMFQHTVTGSRVRRLRPQRRKQRNSLFSCPLFLFDSGQEVRPHRAPGTPQVAAQLQPGPGALRPAGAGHR